MNTSVHIYVTRTYPKDTPTTTKKIETIQLNQNVTNVTQTKWPFTSATVMKWMQLHKTLQPVPSFLLWSLHSIWRVAPSFVVCGHNLSVTTSYAKFSLNIAGRSSQTLQLPTPAGAAKYKYGIGQKTVRGHSIIM